MRSYEEYQKELVEEMKQMHLKTEELDDANGVTRPEPMTPDMIEILIKGHQFKFSLDGDHFQDYLIEARRISETILKRSIVHIERAAQTI